MLVQPRVCDCVCICVCACGYECVVSSRCALCAMAHFVEHAQVLSQAHTAERPPPNTHTHTHSHTHQVENAVELLHALWNVLHLHRSSAFGRRFFDVSLLTSNVYARLTPGLHGSMTSLMSAHKRLPLHAPRHRTVCTAPCAAPPSHPSHHTTATCGTVWRVGLRLALKRRCAGGRRWVAADHCCCCCCWSPLTRRAAVSLCAAGPAKASSHQ